MESSVCRSVLHFGGCIAFKFCMDQRMNPEFCVFALQQEAGRYPAYKEMVAEYGWLDKRMLTIPKYDFTR